MAFCFWLKDHQGFENLEDLSYALLLHYFKAAYLPISNYAYVVNTTWLLLQIELGTCLHRSLAEHQLPHCIVYFNGVIGTTALYGKLPLVWVRVEQEVCCFRFVYACADVYR